jgi:hypothetical protein
LQGEGALRLYLTFIASVGPHAASVHAALFVMKPLLKTAGRIAVESLWVERSIILKKMERHAAQAPALRERHHNFRHFRSFLILAHL